MKLGRITVTVVSAATVLATGAGAAAAVQAQERSPADAGRSAAATVTLRDLGGKTVGEVRLRSRNGHTLVRAHVRGLDPGFHGFHVHAVGACDPESDFASAGGHYNPTDADHGNHAGDLPSLLATDEGGARIAFRTDRFTVLDLRDADGSAIVVHKGRDNYANIPDRYYSTAGDASGPDAKTLAAGDAGSRIACGELP